MRDPPGCEPQVSVAFLLDPCATLLRSNGCERVYGQRAGFCRSHFRCETKGQLCVGGSVQRSSRGRALSLYPNGSFLEHARTVPAVDLVSLLNQIHSISKWGM